MEQKEKQAENQSDVPREEVEREAKDDADRSMQMEAGRRVMEENKEVLRRLADA